jgi:hypothetical protein
MDRKAHCLYPSKAYTAVRRAWDGAGRRSRETEGKAVPDAERPPNPNESGELYAMTVIWRGTPAESKALVDAVDHNCACEFWMNVRLSCCPAHRMLVEDQRALDGLLFARRIADQLRREEWTGAHETVPSSEVARQLTTIGG